MHERRSTRFETALAFSKRNAANAGGVDFLERGATQIVMAGSGEDERARGLLKEIRSHFLPRAVVILLGDEASRRFFGEKNEALRTMISLTESQRLTFARFHLPVAVESRELRQLLSS